MDHVESEQDKPARNSDSKAMRLLRKSMVNNRIVHGPGRPSLDEAEEDEESRPPKRWRLWWHDDYPFLDHVLIYFRTSHPKKRTSRNRESGGGGAAGGQNIYSSGPRDKILPPSESNFTLEMGPSFQLSQTSIGSSRAGVSRLDQLHHNLKPREEDILYLKKRILFPGIFEQESSDEDSKPRRNLRRVPCKQKYSKSWEGRGVN